MKIKTKIITRKEFYLETIADILKKAFIDDFIENKCGTVYSDDENGNRDCVPSDEITEEDFDLKEYYYDEALEYIKLELNDELNDWLTCVNGKGGEQDEQIGMLEFISMFSDLKFKVEDFTIERDDPIGICADYSFKVMFVKYEQKFGYLSDFFSMFVYTNAEKILNSVVDFINNK